MEIAFVIYTILVLIQTLVTDTHTQDWGYGIWIIIEPLAILACCATVIEAYYWATTEMTTPARGRLATGLLGIAVVLANFIPPNSDSPFVYARLMIYAGLFGFMLFGILMLWVLPFPVEIHAAFHALLLTIWLCLRVFFARHPRNWIYQPCVAALYCFWIILAVGPRQRGNGGPYYLFARARLPTPPDK